MRRRWKRIGRLSSACREEGRTVASSPWRTWREGTEREGSLEESEESKSRRPSEERSIVADD